MNKGLLILLAFISLGTLAEEMKLTVDRVPDGDTIRTFNSEGNKIVVRLLGVDTPERKFANESQGKHAIDATNFLKNLIPKGSTIKVVTGDTIREKWDRVLGTVYAGEINVNLELLKSGMGMPYFIAPFDFDMAEEYRAACIEAQSAGLGVFNPKNRLRYEPYIFRMKVAKKVGRNLVGDSVSGKYFAPEEYRKVPICNRVFFYDAREAVRFGYGPSDNS